jgi:hypothetical protein
MSLRAKDLLQTSHRYALAVGSPEFWRLLCLDAMCLASRSCRLNIWPQTGHTYATSEPGGISSTTGDTSRLYREATDSFVVGEATSPLTTGTETAPRLGMKPDEKSGRGGGTRPSKLGESVLEPFTDRSRGESCGEDGFESTEPLESVRGWGQADLALSAFAVSNQRGRSESEWLRLRKMSGRYLEWKYLSKEQGAGDAGVRGDMGDAGKYLS